MNMKKKVLFLIVSLYALLALAGCSQKQADKPSGKISIVTSTNIYSDISKQLAGRYGDVHAIISNGNIDPHDFDPTTQSAKTVARADIVVENGSGYDSWMDRLAVSNDKKIVSVAQDVMGYKSNSNPHIWFDLDMPRKYANYLTKRLIKLQPQHRAYFEKRRRVFLNELAEVEKIAQDKHGRGQKVYVSEPVFDYALHDLGYKVGNKAFEDAIERETDPSPHVIQQMKNGMHKHEVAFFVNNEQASSSTVKTFLRICKQEGVPIVNVRETKPNKISYLDWLKQSYQKVGKISAK
jgi:zinc/manganese transport system substrate-binding protein